MKSKKKTVRKPAVVEPVATVYTFPDSTNYWDIAEWLCDATTRSPSDHVVRYPCVLSFPTERLTLRDQEELELLSEAWDLALPMVVASTPAGDRVIDALSLRLAKAENERDKLREELEWKLKGLDDLDQEDAESVLAEVRDSLTQVKDASFATPFESETKRRALSGPPKTEKVR